MESQLDEFDVPRIIRRAATSSIEVYEAHDSPLIDLFLEDTEGPYVHLCVNFKGRDSILCISSQPLDSAREVPKINLPLEVFVGDVSFEDCFRGLYQRNPPPGSSFGPDGVSWSGAIGFYLMDQARRDEKYFITVAHNFARGDPANGEANFAANETLPAGTPALQPTKAGLQNDIRNCQLTIRSTEASIEDYHRQSRFRAEEIAKEEHKCLVSHSQILMSLPHTAAHQIGHLTTVYELNVDEHMYWDYCLVRVHDNRLGLNRVQGTAIRRIMKSADLDLDEEMLRKQGPSTGETFGRFLEVSSSFGNHPRFPGCRFRMPVIVAGGGIGGGGLWCSKGDSGAPITWRDNAVGIVYGHATATQDDNQVEVQVGVFGELASILQRIKERFGLELVLYAGDD